MNIQQILNEYKRQTNVTNDYIAQKIGVTKSTVSRWCNGQIKKISPDTLQKLSSLIGIDFDQMTRITQFSFEKPILGTVKAGYVHGANTPVGIYEKFEYPIFIDNEAREQGDIFVSSGKVGRSIKLNAEDLATLVHATFADLEQK